MPEHVIAFLAAVGSTFYDPIGMLIAVNGFLSGVVRLWTWTPAVVAIIATLFNALMLDIWGDIPMLAVVLINFMVAYVAYAAGLFAGPYLVGLSGHD